METKHEVNIDDAHWGDEIELDDEDDVPLSTDNDTDQQPSSAGIFVPPSHGTYRYSKSSLNACIAMGDLDSISNIL